MKTMGQRLLESYPNKKHNKDMSIIYRIYYISILTPWAPFTDMV